MTLISAPKSWNEAIDLAAEIASGAVDPFSDHDYYDNGAALAAKDFWLGQPRGQYLPVEPNPPLGPYYRNTLNGKEFSWDQPTQMWVEEGDFKGDTGAVGPVGTIDFTDDRLYDWRNLLRNPSGAGAAENAAGSPYEDQVNETPPAFNPAKLFWAYNKLLVIRPGSTWESDSIISYLETYDSVVLSGPSPKLDLMTAMGYGPGDSFRFHALRIIRITNTTGSEEPDMGNINATRQHGTPINVGVWAMTPSVIAGTYKVNGSTVAPVAGEWLWHTRNKNGQLPFQSPGMPDTGIWYIAAPIAFKSTSLDTISTLNPMGAIIDSSNSSSEGP